MIRGMRFAPERVMASAVVHPAVSEVLAPGLAPTGRAQRVDGALRLRYARDENGTTRLADLYQRAPCRVLFPDVERDEPPQAVLLTTSGGLTGGDRLRIEIDIGAGARATLTTQAAEKLYRAADDEADTQIDIALRVGTGAYAEWLAQETILFDRARLRRRLGAELMPGARLLAVESIVFGRRAMDEDYRQGRLHDSWHIRCGGRLVWADALHLNGDIAAQRAAPYGFGKACGSATVLYAGEDAAQQLDAVRTALVETAPDSGATVIDGVLVARLLADDAVQLRHAVATLTTQLRASTAGLPAQLPRVWQC